MNVDPTDFSRSLPLRLKPTGDNGVYLAASQSRSGKWWRVDVTTLQCDCESATKGWSRKAAIRNGGSPPYEKMCGHLKAALAYDSMALRAAIRSLTKQEKSI